RWPGRRWRQRSQPRECGAAALRGWSGWSWSRASAWCSSFGYILADNLDKALFEGETLRAQLVKGVPGIDQPAHHFWQRFLAGQVKGDHAVTLILYRLAAEAGQTGQRVRRWAAEGQPEAEALLVRLSQVRDD